MEGFRFESLRFRIAGVGRSGSAGRHSNFYMRNCKRALRTGIPEVLKTFSVNPNNPSP